MILTKFRSRSPEKQAVRSRPENTPDAAAPEKIRRVALDRTLLDALDRVDAFRQDTTAPLLDDAHLKTIAGSPEAVQALIGIAGDEGAPLGRRYAAAEAIAQSGRTEVLADDADAARAVAAMMAEAMVRDEFHNRWGVPGHFVGQTGKLLLALGPGLRDALRPLLADERPLDIVGSQAATLHHAHRYRIRDLASYLLAVDRGVSWQDDPDPAVRDRNIDRLER